LSVGVASDYGKRQAVVRAPPTDNILYQTERWHDSSFAYEIPIKDEGDYVLVLKFAEVYFYAQNMKVMHPLLNLLVAFSHTYCLVTRCIATCVRPKRSAFPRKMSNIMRKLSIVVWSVHVA